MSSNSLIPERRANEGKEANVREDTRTTSLLALNRKRLVVFSTLGCNKINPLCTLGRLYIGSFVSHILLSKGILGWVWNEVYCVVIEIILNDHLHYKFIQQHDYCTSLDEFVDFSRLFASSLCWIIARVATDIIYGVYNYEEEFIAQWKAQQRLLHRPKRYRDKRTTHKMAFVSFFCHVQ